MAGNLINQYLWLINTLQKGPIPHEEISRKWEDSIFNDNPGKGLPKKTFRNHCEKIAEIFGVDIECEKKQPYGYYLGEPAEADAWKLDILNPLLIQAAIKDNSTMRNRIVIKPSDSNPYLIDILEYIKKRELVSFRYHLTMANVRNDENASEAEKNMRDIDIQYQQFLPLGVVCVNSTWFVVFVLKNDNRISVFRFNMLHDITPTGIIDDSDSYANWSAKEFINNFTFSDNDNDFIDERMVLAMELGSLTYDNIQQKHNEWSDSYVELREGIQNLLLEYHLPRK